MNYIENIFLCLALPYILTLFFVGKKGRFFLVLITTGMGICLLSAYVSSFFMSYYGADAVTSAVEITPVCEEVMKLLPLLLWMLIFEPEREKIPVVALMIALGFATFENVCYIVENGAENVTFLLMRGISAGAVHILCGLAEGGGLAYVFYRRWLAFMGIIAVLGACIVFHGIYNLLIISDGIWKNAGYLLPILLLLISYWVRRLVMGKKAYMERTT